MPLFRRGAGDSGSELPRGDRGAASFDDFDGALVARKASVRIRLAASDPCQGELAELIAAGERAAETAIGPRSVEDERTDAPMPVRLFVGRRVTGVVGRVPRGFEGLVDDTLRRLEDRGDRPRIPVHIVGKPGRYRVELDLGAVR